ncbi:uncharacterized protein LOC120555826 [Perca fluviatilis]|uniref:uncharacterized protein LOC120555826 n=1 Tax=Perca fluviatilis TaxID=8168 RepID=UPI001963DA22|nr:uncharacterized protein LOC120555826 [Perca fluviatilis]
MAESEVSIERDNEWLNFEGRPYLFEPEYTDEELQIMEENRRAAEEAAEITEIPDTPNRCAGDWWCSCGQCQPMATEEECLCCRESDVFRQCLENSEACCVTAMDDFPALINPAVVRTFFNVPKINWKRRPVPEGPDGQLSAKQCRLVAYRIVLEWGLQGERLGRKERRVMPSCVVTTIRTKYPSPTGDYRGFQEAEELLRII